MGDGGFVIIDIREFHSGLAAFKGDNELWGFIDKQGNIVIKPIFKSVSDFNEHFLASAVKDGANETIIINDKGEDIVRNAQIIKRKYEFLEWKENLDYVASITMNGVLGKKYYLVHKDGVITPTTRVYPDPKKLIPAMYNLSTICYAEIPPFTDKDTISYHHDIEYDDRIFVGRDNTFIITDSKGYYDCWFQMINREGHQIEFDNTIHQYHYSTDLKVKRLNEKLVYIYDSQYNSVDIYSSEGKFLTFKNSISATMVSNSICVQKEDKTYRFYDINGKPLFDKDIVSYEYNGIELVVYYIENGIYVSSYIDSFPNEKYTQRSKNDFIKLYLPNVTNNYGYLIKDSGLKSTKDVCYTTNDPYEYDKFTFMYGVNEISFPNKIIDEIFISMENYTDFLIGKVSNKNYVIVKFDEKTHEISKRIDINCEAIKYQNGYFIIRKNNRYGLIDIDGNELFPCDNYQIKFLDKNTIYISGRQMYMILHLQSKEFENISIDHFKYGLFGRSGEYNLLHELSSNRDKMIVSDEEADLKFIYSTQIINLYLTKKCKKIRISFDNLIEKLDDHYVIKKEYLPYLSYIDLKDFEFKNVDVRGINFTNTNARINPNLVYKNDISDCEFNIENLVIVPEYRFSDSKAGTNYEFSNHEDTIVHGDNYKLKLR